MKASNRRLGKGPLTLFNHVAGLQHNDGRFCRAIRAPQRAERITIRCGRVRCHSKASALQIDAHLAATSIALLVLFLGHFSTHQRLINAPYP